MSLTLTYQIKINIYTSIYSFVTERTQNICPIILPQNFKTDAALLIKYDNLSSELEEDLDRKNEDTSVCLDTPSLNRNQFWDVLVVDEILTYLTYST